MLGKKLSDRYEILSELGRGGMGVVYRARDPRLNRDVAVKLIPPSLLTPQMKQRFEAEAQVVAGMDHPAIVPIHDFGDHEESLFFVMPVVEGTPLRTMLREQSLSLGDVLEVGIQVAEALDYSHTRGVVHRDIKPENVMVTRDDTTGLRVRVMDFGLARTTDVTRMTRTGTLIGTMAYISPEQVAGDAVDGRSDIYALGTVLYEMVSNEVPFTGEMQSVLYRIVHELPQSPRERGAEIDDELDKLIADCIQKEASARPQRAGDIAKTLRQYRSSLEDSEQLKSVLATRTMIMPAAKRSPFVGRKDHVKELQTRFNQALAGKCQFVTVGGEAGVGKTRLLEELENLAAARQVRVLHGRFLEQEAAFPYFGFCEAIQEYFQQKDTGSAGGVAPDLGDLGADLISLFPMLSEIEPIRSAATGSSQFAQPAEARSAESQAQIFELLARTLTRLAAGDPLVLLFEDLHGADVSVEALQYVIRRLGPTPTLVVGTYRTSEVDRRHPLSKMLQAFRSDRQYGGLTLGPLEPDEHRSFLSTLVGGSEVEDDFARKLFEASEGNPFFTKELVRSLMDSGNVVQDDTGTWTLSGGTEISAEALPATIQEAVEERVGRLPDDLREALSTAAVMGKTFEFRDLEDLVDVDTDLDDAIDQLVGQGLVEEERGSRGDCLTFTSGVVREVLYGELSRRRRRSVHRKYARLLEKRHGGRLEGVYPQLVHHFAEGDEPEQTVEYGLAYARRSLESFSPDEVIRAARAALEFLDREWEGERTLEGEARLLLAAGRQMAGDVAGALKDIDAALRVFEREEDRPRVVEALLTGARLAWQARRTDEAAGLVERGVAAARDENDVDSLRELLSLAATLANLRGEYTRANDYLQEAERLAPARKDEAEIEVPGGGTLVIALANPVPAASPADNQFVEEMELWANVCETLLATDEEGHLVPALCESWEMQNDGRTFRLVLREGVRFHDGQALTAADVKKSFERAARETTLDLPAALAAIEGVVAFTDEKSDNLEGVVASADRELEIRLTDALPIYPALLTDTRMSVVRRAADGTLLGTGPFRLQSRDEQRIVLARHDDYWLPITAYVDAVEFRLGLSAAEIATGFRADEFDVARDLLLDDLDAILRDPHQRAHIVEVPRKFSYFVLFNTRTAASITGDAMRRALAGVVRPQEMVWQTLGRFAQPASGFLPPGIIGHDPGRRHATLSVEKARKMLDEAGAPATITLKAAVQPLLQDRYGALTRALFDEWAELGVTVEITTPDMDSFLHATENPEGVDLYIGRFGPDYEHPDNFTTSLFNSEIGFLRGWFSSPETDAALEEARSTGRPEERQTLYRNFENGLLQGGVIAPLFFDIDYRVAQPSVRNLALASVPPFVNYAGVGKADDSAPRASARPRAAGTVHIPMTAGVDSLDPALGETAESDEVRSAVYESLLKAVGEAQVVPWLVESFEVAGSGQRLHFRLRPGIRFHDDRRLTARDVRFSFERFLQTPTTNRSVLAPVTGAQDCIDGKTRALAGFRIHSATDFTMELDKPLAFFPAVLSFGPLAIVPEGTGAIGTSFRDGAVGTGPFRAVEFEPGRRIELERNPAYWRAGEPASQGLVFHLGVSPEEILAGLKSGRYSVVGDLRPGDVEALRREKAFAAGYREAPSLSTYFGAFNTRRGPLADRGLRRRLSAAVDVPRIVRQTLGRLAIPAHGIIPPGLAGHEAQVPGAVTSAPGERLSAEIELTAAIHPVYTAEYADFLRQLTDTFAQVSVRLKPITETMDEYLRQESEATADIYVARWIADFADADTFASILQSGDGYLGQWLGHDEIDRLIDRARLETDPKIRHATYRRIEEIVADEALLMPFFHEQVFRFARPEVEGLQVSYQSPVVAYEKLKVVGKDSRRHG